MIFSFLKLLISFHLNIIKLLQLKVLNFLLISQSLEETHFLLESYVLLIF